VGDRDRADELSCRKTVEIRFRDHCRPRRGTATMRPGPVTPAQGFSREQVRMIANLHMWQEVQYNEASRVIAFTQVVSDG
jgi:hypothetical protein